jgi:ABC-2 type transport system permease protein
MRREGGSLLRLPRARILSALIRRDFLITRSYRLAFALDVFFGMMNLIVFYFISRTVTLRSGTLDGAPSYFAFASVGIILTVVMQSATTGLARRVREEQLTGTLEALAVQPVSAVEMAAGLTGFPFVFGTLRAGLYMLFAAALLNLDLSHSDVAGFVLVLVATGITLSAVGVLMGAIVLVFKQGDALAAVITFGFGLLSGALFPRGLLPGWLQALGGILPTRFALDGMRRALFEGGGWVGDLTALVAAGLILLPLSIGLFSWVLTAVKKSGTLSQY